MTWKVTLALAAIAAALWLLWPSSPSERDEPAVQHEAEPAGRDAARAATVPSHARVERPRLHVPESEEAPRVAIDRRPWDPERETRGAHERRTRIADAFDRFRDETNMSDERAQELLRLLYDYQETFRILNAEFEGHKPFRGDWDFEYWVRKLGADWYLVRYEADEQLRAMLSDDEMRAWRRTMQKAHVWHVLRDPVILPVD